MDGVQMAVEMVRLPESEKITINLGQVDLGQIDLLVAERFYANRTDLIRTAIRNQLDRHAAAIEAATTRQALTVGVRRVGRAELEQARRKGERLAIAALGLVSIDVDVTPELARAAIASITVLGTLHASPAVRQALAGRVS